MEALSSNYKYVQCRQQHIRYYLHILSHRGLEVKQQEGN